MHIIKLSLSSANLVTVQNKAGNTDGVVLLQFLLLSITQLHVALMYLSIGKGKRILVLFQQDCKPVETMAKT